MKLGVLTNLLGDLPFEEALAYFKSIGLEMIEVGAGGYPGTQHADPDILLNDEKALNKFKKTVAKYGLEISSLSCHANPVHPNKEIAAQFDEAIKKTILLAEKLDIHQINTFSGCPGDCETSENPNWVTCAWPPEYAKVVEWQWSEKLIPYWKETVEFAKAHGVNKIAFEMHPGFCVYNPETLLRLRKEVGPEIGANLDPSHLIWQGMDPVAVIKELGKENAIFHFHAKDTKIDKYNTAVNGCNDYKSYTNFLGRSWSFRAVGYGNDVSYWKDIISALSMVGYDYAISIEHEDGLMAPKEGLEKAVGVLKSCLIKEANCNMWWA